MLPIIYVDDTVLKAVDKFCYLGSVLAFAASIEDYVDALLARASAAPSAHETTAASGS